jgi:TRAP-type transport system periplasmic protein
MKAFFLAALLAAGVAHAQTTWRLATGYRAESFHTQNIEAFAIEVMEASRGQLKIEVSPNNSLVKLAEIPAAVANGKLDAGEAIMSGMGKEAPLAGADGVPFVVGSYADVQRLWALQRPGIEREFAKLGLKPLYAVPWPPQGLYTTKPIKDIQDLRGQKMRTYNPTTVRIAQLLGATSVDVPMAQVGQALAAGKLDAMITSAVTGVENRVWDGLKYCYELNAWYPKNIVFVNAKSFADLPKAPANGWLPWAILPMRFLSPSTACANTQRTSKTFNHDYIDS